MKRKLIVTKETADYRLPDPAPCGRCGKPETHGHARWCGIPTTRAQYNRKTQGNICLSCMAILEHPENGCPRCQAVEETRKAAASEFFAARAQRKIEQKIEAQILADEANAADLI